MTWILVTCLLLLFVAAAAFALGRRRVREIAPPAVPQEPMPEKPIEVREPLYFRRYRLDEASTPVRDRETDRHQS